MNSSPPVLTVSQLAHWGRVTNRQHEVDFWTPCIFCQKQNRVRLGAGQTLVDHVRCEHYLRYEFSKAEGTVRFHFGR